MFEIAKEACAVAGKKFKDEEARQNALQPLFDKVLGPTQTKSRVPGAEADAILYVSGSSAPVIVWQYKNEMGSGNEDVYIQGTLTSAKFWASDVS